VARRLHLHIGLPKTGTTYLQQVVWAHRDRLLDDGLLVPGRGHRDHLWAALAAQGRRGLKRRHPDAPKAWDRLADEVRRWDGDALITHEFFCAAGEDDVARLVEQVAPARVEVVVTARDPLSMLTAGWQELVKNGSTVPAGDAGRPREASPEFSWRTWDLHGVLQRWSAVVPPEQVHVLVLPGRDEPPEQHWRNFAATVGIRPDLPLPDRAANPSLGVVQVELLRRVNAHLDAFHSPTDRGTWIRGQLAERFLAEQAGEPFTMPPELVEQCRKRGRRARRLLREQPFDVVGDVRRLSVPDDLPARRTPEEVGDAELVDASGALVAVMLAAVRDSGR
jgi:hypothetical protein